MARNPTAHDIAAIETLRNQFKDILRDAKIVSPLRKYAQLNPELNDPMTGNAPDIIVYRKTHLVNVRSTAVQLGKANWRRYDQYLLSQTEKMSGHAQLMAFNPSGHAWMTKDWIDAACRYIYGGFPDARRDEWGLVENPPAELRKEMVDLMCLKKHGFGKRTLAVTWTNGTAKPPSSWPSEARSRFNVMKQKSIPSYAKVLSIHLCTFPHARTKMEKRWARILHGVEPIDNSIRLALDLWNEWTVELGPKIFKGMQNAAREMQYLSPSFRTTAMTTEKSTWTTMAEQISPDDPKAAEIDFGLWIRQTAVSAKATTMDPAYFYARITEDKEFRSEVFSHPAYVYRNLTALDSALYGAMYFWEKAICRIWIIGTIYMVYMWTLLGLPKVFTVLGHLYWLEKMDSSQLISSLQPRDPYGPSKKLTAWIAGFIPLWVGYIFRWDLVRVSWLAEALAIFWLRATDVSNAAAGIIVDNVWMTDAEAMWEKIKDDENKRLIYTAQTGTGKSSLGVAALTISAERLMPQHHLAVSLPRCWVFVPTLINLEKPMPEFLGFGTAEMAPTNPDKRVQVLRAGIRIMPKTRIVFLTYQHGYERLRGGDFDPTRDFAVLDECHMDLPAQRLVEHALKDAYCFMASATPAPLPTAPVAKVHLASQKKKWKNHVVREKMVSTANTYKDWMQRSEPVEGMVHPPSVLAERCIIFEDTHKHVAECIEALRELNKAEWPLMPGNMPPVVEISSHVKPGTVEWIEREAAFKSGRYIAVGTKQARTGMDIKPHPPWMVIDSGKDVYEHEGEILFANTSAADEEQGLGRNTRNSSDRDGLAIVNVNGGKRKEKFVTYPSPSYLVDDWLAKSYSLPALKPVEKPACRTWPYFEVRNVSENDEAALTFCALAIAAGVKSNDLPRFYNRYYVDKIKLPAEYEWLSRQYMAPNYTEAPAYDHIWSLWLHNHTIGWNVRMNSTNFVLSDGLSWTGLIIPMRGSWCSIDDLPALRSRREVLVELLGGATEEAANYEAIMSGLEEMNERLNGKVKELTKALKSSRERSKRRNAEEKQKADRHEKRAIQMSSPVPPGEASDPTIQMSRKSTAPSTTRLNVPLDKKIKSLNGDDLLKWLTNSTEKVDYKTLSPESKDKHKRAVGLVKRYQSQTKSKVVDHNAFASNFLPSIGVEGPANNPFDPNFAPSTLQRPKPVQARGEQRRQGKRKGDKRKTPEQPG